MNTGNIKPSAAAKKFSVKKPKDKPKRPLSAYNFFLRAERAKIVKFIKGEGPDEHEPDQPEADLSVLKLKGGRICFEQMGKLIGKRWKTLGAESLKKYSDMALADAERYKIEMAEYKARRDERIRAEVAVARQSQVSVAATQVSYSGTSGVEPMYAPPYFDSYGYPPPSHPGMPPHGSQPAYPHADYARSEPYMPQSAYGEFPRHQQYGSYYSHSRGGYSMPPYSSQYYPSQHMPEHTSSAQKGYSMPPAHQHHMSSTGEHSTSAQPFYPAQVPSSHRVEKEEENMFYPPSQGRSYRTEPGSPKRSRTHPRPF